MKIWPQPGRTVVQLTDEIVWRRYLDVVVRNRKELGDLCRGAEKIKWMQMELNNQKRTIRRRLRNTRCSSVKSRPAVS
jgi:hypothetical protein